jgi:hypothetical protein
MHTKIMYLTAHGRARFDAEVDELVSVRRPQLTEPALAGVFRVRIVAVS